MKLTKKAIKAIDTQDIRLKLALALGCSVDTIRRYIKANSDDLTKAAALVVIRAETKLKDDQILQQEVVKA